MLLSLTSDRRNGLGPESCLYFSPSGERHALLKYSHPKRQKEVNTPLNDEWLYKTANDEPFAYE